METPFQPAGLPTLIGSLPSESHAAAAGQVLAYTPEIPLWVQLPANKREGMMLQFLPGLPGLTEKGDKTVIETDTTDFENELLAFYEDYLAVTEGGADLMTSRFAMLEETAPGFFELIRQIENNDHRPTAVKGQITGPVTLGTGTVDQNGRSIFYDDRLRDVMIKLLALKARWQVRQLSRFQCPVIIFFDEPALTGFGSSAFISISREEIAACFKEVIDAVHDEGGLAGIHVCANAEWSLVLDSPADVISFDAYAYFDRLLLYRDSLKSFMAAGGVIAWGIVPTLNADDLEKESVASLTAMWHAKAAQLEALGIDRSVIVSQALITPACGTGSLTAEQATRALHLTAEVSKKIRTAD